MAALGVPDEYEVFIVDSLTEATMARLPWTSIQWGRVNKGVSQAQVTMDARSDHFACCEVLSIIHAWDQLLVVERNGFRVWDGLITGWATGSTITVTAYDRSVMFNKRLIGQDYDWTYVFGNDGFVYVLEPLINQAGLLTAGVNQMPCTISLADPQYGGPGVIGADFGGSWRVASLTTLAAVFQEFATSSYLNFTQRCDKFFISLGLAEMTYNGDSADDLGMLPAGEIVPRRMVLSPSTTLMDAASLGVTVDAIDVYTVGYTAGVGQGVAGFVNTTTSDTFAVGYTPGPYVPYVLHGVATEAETQNGSVQFDAFGDPIRSTGNENTGPRVALENVVVSPAFGADLLKPDLSNLLPGVGLTVDFADACSLDVYHETWTGFAVDFEPRVSNRITLARIAQIDVNVTMDASGINETVTLSLEAYADI